MEPIALISSVFLDIFSGLMPFFLIGIIASAVVEVFVDEDWIKNSRKRWGTSLGVMLIVGIFVPVLNGGVIPLASKLYKKGFGFYSVSFLLVAAPLFNIVTLLNGIIALGWGSVIWLRGISGMVLLAASGGFFSLFFPDLKDYSQSIPLTSKTGGKGRNRLFIQSVLDEFFNWMPCFVIGLVITALLRVFLMDWIWINPQQNIPYQILTIMVYGITLSVSSAANVFVPLNWVGHLPLAVILAFLLTGSLVSIPGIIMMIKGFGVKKSVYWYVLMLLMIFICSLLFQLLLAWVV